MHNSSRCRNGNRKTVTVNSYQESGEKDREKTEHVLRRFRKTVSVVAGVTSGGKVFQMRPPKKRDRRQLTAIWRTGQNQETRQTDVGRSVGRIPTSLYVPYRRAGLLPGPARAPPYGRGHKATVRPSVRLSRFLILPRSQDGSMLSSVAHVCLSGSRPVCRPTCVCVCE